MHSPRELSVVLSNSSWVHSWPQCSDIPLHLSSALAYGRPIQHECVVGYNVLPLKGAERMHVCVTNNRINVRHIKTSAV